MSIGKRMRQLRKSLGLTQSDFGEPIGLKQAIIGQMENGSRSITDRTVSDICREFDVSETWLRTGEGEMFRKLTTLDEITDFYKGLVGIEDDNDIRIRFAHAVAKMDKAQWAALEKFLQDMAASGGMGGE